jgi:hypothetical protein
MKIQIKIHYDILIIFNQQNNKITKIENPNGF